MIGCCALLAAVFAVSAGSKVRTGPALPMFRESIRSMGVLPERLVRPVAVAVPLVEAVAAGLLAVPSTARAGAVLALCLLLAFSAAIASVLRRGASASCRCFGVREVQFGRRHLVRNGLVAVAAVATAAAPATPHTAHPAAIVLAVVVGFVVAAFVVVFDELVDLFSAAGAPANTGVAGRRVPERTRWM
jgi:hypothetical protein